VDARARSRTGAWLVGLAAATIALGALLGAHAAAGEVPFPPLSLADRVVRLTPGGVATWAIDHLGHAAQPLLSVGAALVLLALFGVIGRAASRRGARAQAAAGSAVAAICAAAWLADPVRGPALTGFTACASGGLVFAAALHAFDRVATGLTPPPSTERRRLLLLAGSRVFALAGAAVVGDALLGRLVAPGSSAPVLGARNVDFHARPRFPVIPGLSPEVTSVADHYVVDIDISDPMIDAGSWRLAVDGAVARPLSLGFDELQTRFAMVEQHSVLTCISNTVGGPLVGNSLWEGPRLAELLEAAGPAGAATTVAFHSADGYSAAIPIALARDPTTLVAIAQDGEALAREHGFPCRIRVPALYGMMNAKWVERIEVRTRTFEGYWAQQGWSKTGVVRTESRIDTPRKAQAGVPGWIAGVAWAGRRGISRVEVSTDGGRSWVRARLRKPLSPVAWTQWAYRWTPAQPGTAVLVCRATDGTGAVQDARRRPPHPAGDSGYHVVHVPVA
jgi:DMSO/TMAO reductase YedYZ molybdopterin-dependent catalytic subunit